MKQVAYSSDGKRVEVTAGPRSVTVRVVSCGAKDITRLRFQPERALELARLLMEAVELIQLPGKQKYCPDCDTFKWEVEFHSDRTRPDGLGAYCKVCRRARNRAISLAYYHAHKGRKDEVAA